MAKLFFPITNETITDFNSIKSYLNANKILIEKWEASKQLSIDATQEEVLKAFEHELKPFMDKNGFKTADVINVHPKTENLIAIRQKFMKEHRHNDDEVRFFVDGEGNFKEFLLLSPGYNIIVLKAQDKFKRNIAKDLEIIYQGNSISHADVINLENNFLTELMLILDNIFTKNSLVKVFVNSKVFLKITENYHHFLMFPC
jgi:cupin superfamily acireductone dioxygenase involved in methionine salvage